MVIDFVSNIILNICAVRNLVITNTFANAKVAPIINACKNNTNLCARVCVKNVFFTHTISWNVECLYANKHSKTRVRIKYCCCACAA